MYANDLKRICLLLSILAVIGWSFSCDTQAAQIASQQQGEGEQASKPAVFSFSSGIRNDSSGMGTIDSTDTTSDGNYPEGSKIGVKAVPVEGNYFSGWYDATQDGNLVSIEPTYSFDLTNDTALYAGFAKTIHTFGVKKVALNSGEGDVAIVNATLDGRYAYGREITVTATPHISSNFIGWFDAEKDGNLLSKEVVYTHKLVKDTVIYAIFEKKVFNVFSGLSKDGSGKGGVNNNFNGRYSYGTSFRFEAVADKGSAFVGWYDSISGGNLLSTNWYYVVSVESDVLVYARFELDPPIYFDDIALEIAVRNEINKKSGQLTKYDAYRVKNLKYDPVASGTLAIKSLKGIENLKFLSELNLNYCYITDLSPLLSLDKLTGLNLTNCEISDISLLAQMPELMVIRLEGNKIADITALSKITSVFFLDLSRNSITDLSPLKQLGKLSILDLDGNNITDISVLESLSELSLVNLRWNSQITSFEPLLKNVGFGGGDRLELNAKSNYSPAIQREINTLKLKGVTLVLSDYK